MAKTVTRILREPEPNDAAQPLGKLRVAAYCRVSTDREEQKTSFEGQVKTYSEKIKSNPDWEYVGIYADDGITGTSTRKRAQFKKMIVDCEAGMIDLVITKSISRFARNTLECITYVRKLNKIGVHIIFEKENIDTRAKFSEMILTILAAFAQEESRSISENTSWGVRKRFENGETRWNKLYGYEKNEKGDYQIVPEEAKVVRHIFDRYEKGATLTEIRKEFAEKKVLSPKGAETWTAAAIQSILVNERYAGDILLQKYYVDDYLTHHCAKNDGALPTHYKENHHKAIVPKKQFLRVQEILGMRRNIPSKKDGTSGSCNQYPLGEMLRCPYCGSPLYQRAVLVQTKHTAGWCCERGDTPCGGFVIRSAFVEKALLDAYNNLDVESIEEKLEHPTLGAEAKKLMAIKAEHPKFDRVDYWWVDDLIDRIELGAHTLKPTDAARFQAAGKTVQDDRVLMVYWRCGMTSTAFTGIERDSDQPSYVAALVKAQNERRAAQAAKEAEAV